MDIQVTDHTSSPWLPHRGYEGVFARVVLGGQTGTDLEIMAIRIVPGAQVPPHQHERSAETFYVLAGEGAFHIQGRWVPCHVGSCAHAKAGTVPGAKNTGGEDLCVLAIFAPPLS